MLWAVYTILAAGLLYTSVKYILLLHDLRELTRQLGKRLDTDTNAMLHTSGSNRELRSTANELNRHLSELRRQQLQYRNGNNELKTAVTNISPDLRPPMTAICGYLEMMKPLDKPERIEHCLDIISERTDAMKQLTDELLQYSVIPSDTALNTEELSLNEVLESCILGYYGSLNSRGIVPQISMPEEKIMRKTDRESLSRVLSNLMNNAMKYSAGDLEISLDTEGNIAFSNASPELSGIDIGRLFDRFYTVNTANNSTGLGLSIARTLTERIGGSISAAYKNGRLTVTVSLPEKRL